MTIAIEAKIVITEASAAELAELVSNPQIRNLMAAGCVAVRSDPESTRSTNMEATGMLPSASSTKARGHALFERRAKQNSVEFRRSYTSEAGDYVAGLNDRRLPVRIMSSESPRISLRKEWSQPGNLVLAYAWIQTGRIFLMSYSTAADILGDKALKSSSFVDSGFYTTLCTRQRMERMALYEDRWDMFFTQKIAPEMSELLKL